MKVSEVLDKAADLIEPDGAWTQGVNARDADGNPTSALDDTATCWCALGAIAHIDDSRRAYLYACALSQQVWAVRRFRDVPHWNDDPERTQAEVVAALRAAAQAEREAGR